MSEAETFRRAVALFREACALDGARRTAFVNDRCGGDAELRDRVHAMLNRDASPADAFGEAGGVRLLARRILSSPDSQPPHLDLSANVPTLTGQYRIVRVIGEGGMGVVYGAEQARPRRAVALKMLRAGRSSLETLRRFAREAELLGRLQHPAIAQIYEAGAADASRPEQAFIAMEFVRGEPI